MVSTSPSDHLPSSIVTLSVDHSPLSPSPVHSHRSDSANFTEESSKFSKEGFRKCNTNKQNSKITLSTEHKSDSDDTMDMREPKKNGKRSPKSTFTAASNATANCATTTISSSSTAVPPVSHSVSSSPIAITSGALHTSNSNSIPITTEPPSSSSPEKAKGTEAKTEFSQMESPPDWPPTEPPPVEGGNVTAWSTDFDVLLADPLGVRAFEDFLSREFSVENLSFFLACRRLYGQSGSTLSTAIEHIYQTYLSAEATEPVNIDSSAIKQIEASLAGEHRNHTLFAPAEKQIYNLMKFDCYPRFLRSQLYTECLNAEQSGRPLPYEEQSGENKRSTAAAEDHQSNASTATPVDSASADHSPGQAGNSSKSKRRSFLPWARIKSSLVNAKAASLSSMPAKESPGSTSSSSAAAAAFRRPMAVRKFASSITYKLRSRSLDEHIHANSGRQQPAASPNSSSTEKSPAGLAGYSSSVEQRSTTRGGYGGQEESLDLDSAAPVFSPSPDDCISGGGRGGGASRVTSSLSSCSTSAEGSPVGAAPPHLSLLRVTFPDGSTTVVACSQSAERLGDLIQRLLLKRGFDWLKEFEVYQTTGDSMPLDLNALVSSVGCSVEVRIHGRNLPAKGKARLKNAFSLLHPTTHSSGSSLDHSPTGVRPQRVQRSLEEGPVTNPSAPMRRFNSVNIDEAAKGGPTSGLAKPIDAQTKHPGTTKASSPFIPLTTIPRPKASHLRDLQNHRHFKSQSEGSEASPLKATSSKPPELVLAQCELHSRSTAVLTETPDSDSKPSLRRFTSDPPLPELSSSSYPDATKEGHIIHPNVVPSTVSPKSLPSLFHVHLDHGHHHHHHHHPHHPIIYHTQHFQHQEHSHVHLIPQRRSSGSSGTSAGAGAAVASAAAPALAGKMAKNSSIS